MSCTRSIIILVDSKIKGPQKGKVPDFSNVPSDLFPSLTLVYVSKDKASNEAGYYFFENEDRGSREATYSVEGDDFTLTVNQYGIHSDYEYFFIESLNLEP